MNPNIKQFGTVLEEIPTSKASGGKFDETPAEYWRDNNRWVAEEKYDGTRLLMHITPEGNRFTTRRISEKTGRYMERTNNFPHLRDIDLPNLHGTVLDGEGYAPDKTFHSTQSIIGSSPEKSWMKQLKIGNLEYWVFDIVRFKGQDVTDKPYHIRLTYLQEAMNDIVRTERGGKYIKRSPQKGIDKHLWYHGLIHGGKEGIMLKNLDSIYYDHKGLVKVKKSQRWTMIITGYKDGNGKHTGKVGSIGVGFYGEEQLTYAGGISDELRDEITANKEKYLGRVVECEAQELTNTGSLRHPRFIDFRIDKRPEDCRRDQNSEIR